MLPVVVLVIDDDIDIREGVAVALRLNGYVVETAENGATALEKLRAGLRPDLIISDLMMPVMNGFAFRQTMLAEPTISKIPFVAYSAITDPNETARHLQADACLFKPADVAQIAGVVQKFYPQPAH